MGVPHEVIAPNGVVQAVAESHAVALRIQTHLTMSTKVLHTVRPKREV